MAGKTKAVEDYLNGQEEFLVDKQISHMLQYVRERRYGAFGKLLL